MEYRVRKRTLKDLPVIMGIMKTRFPHWYRRVPYLVFFTLVVENKSRVEGFITIVRYKEVGEIELLAVSKESEGKGLGTVLLTAALETLQAWHIKHCIVKIRLDNSSAQYLYQKFGFSTRFIKRRRFLGDVYVAEKVVSPMENVKG